MKKLSIILITLLLPVSLFAQERREIKKTKKCTITKTWTEKDNNNQQFYYTTIAVVGDSTYNSYELKVVKYVTENEKHPLKDRILLVTLYPNHSDKQYVNFFSCTSKNGTIERREGIYLYCFTGNKLLIVKQIKDIFIPVSLTKEGEWDDLIEKYYFAEFDEKPKTKTTVKSKK